MDSQHLTGGVLNTELRVLNLDLVDDEVEGFGFPRSHIDRYATIDGFYSAIDVHQRRARQVQASDISLAVVRDRATGDDRGVIEILLAQACIDPYVCRK